MADAEHIEQQDAEQPWQKLPGEKHVWYSRFLTFRDMGPARSVNGAYIIEQQKVATHGKKLNVSPTWYEIGRAHV